MINPKNRCKDAGDGVGSGITVDFNCSAVREPVSHKFCYGNSRQFANSISAGGAKSYPQLAPPNTRPQTLDTIISDFLSHLS